MLSRCIFTNESITLFDLYANAGTVSDINHKEGDPSRINLLIGLVGSAEITYRSGDKDNMLPGDCLKDIIYSDVKSVKFMEDTEYYCLTTKKKTAIEIDSIVKLEDGYVYNPESGRPVYLVSNTEITVNGNNVSRNRIIHSLGGDVVIKSKGTGFLLIFYINGK